MALSGLDYLRDVMDIINDLKNWDYNKENVLNLLKDILSLLPGIGVIRVVDEVVDNVIGRAEELKDEVEAKKKELYQELSEKTGIPPELIAAIHYRESGCNFNTYLHNGQELGTVTTIKPKGRIFNNFTEAAVDALNGMQEETGVYLTQDSSVVMMITFAEIYNGTGYTQYHNTASPYVYSGTDIYVSGKYTSDGNYDSEVVDK